MNGFNELIDGIDKELGILMDMVKMDETFALCHEGVRKYNEILHLSEEIKEIKLFSRNIVDSYFKEKNKVVDLLTRLLINIVKNNNINVWRLENRDMMYSLITKYFNNNINDFACSVSFLELFSCFLKSSKFCSEIITWILTNDHEKVLFFIKQIYLSKRQERVICICLMIYRYFCSNEDMCFELIKAGVVELIVSDYEYYTESNKGIADDILIVLLDGKFKNTIKKYAYDDLIKASNMNALKSKSKIHNKVLEILSFSGLRRSFNVLRINA